MLGSGLYIVVRICQRAEGESTFDDCFWGSSVRERCADGESDLDGRLREDMFRGM